MSFSYAVCVMILLRKYKTNIITKTHNWNQYPTQYTKPEQFFAGLGDFY